MLVQIGIPAKKLLEEIARKRVGRALEAMDLACASDILKIAVKKQIWEFKNDVESKILGSGDENEK